MNSSQLKIISIVIIIIVSSACGTQSKITRRYKSIESTIDAVANPTDYIEITASSLPLNEIASTKTIFDLSERAQKEIIEQIAGKSNTSKEIFADLTLPFLKNTQSTGEITNREFKKRLVISVANNHGDNGADRIESYRVHITIPDKLKNNLKFKYWDKIITQYEEIDIGKLTYSETGSFSISPDIAASGTIKGSVPIQYSGGTTMTEEVSLKKKLASTTGSISDYQLDIIRNSLPLQDINGNLLIEVTVLAEKTKEKLAYEFEGLFKNKVPEPNESKVSINRVNYVYPDFAASESTVDLTYEFIFREVLRGSRTSTESDDIISLKKGSVTSPIKVQVLSENDLEGKFYHIGLDGDLVAVKESGGIPETLTFNSFDKASRFLKWLSLTKNIQVGGNIITIGTTPIQKSQIGQLTIQIE